MTIPHKRNRILPCIFAIAALSVTAPLAFSADGDKDFEKGKFAQEEGDKDAAIKFFTRAADQGHAESANRLAVIYFEKGNKDESFKWAKKSAEQGFLPAIKNLANMYLTGTGVETNNTEGFKWLMKAAEQGDVESQSAVGIHYYMGKGTEKNEVDALKWFQKAAEQGDSTAQVYLGIFHLGGHGIETNYEEAIKWFEKAAEQGSEEAQYQIGLLYEHGLGVKEDPSIAAVRFSKCIDYLKKKEDPEGRFALVLGLGQLMNRNYFDYTRTSDMLRFARESLKPYKVPSFYEEDKYSMPNTSDKEVLKEYINSKKMLENAKEALERYKEPKVYGRIFFDALKPAAESGHPVAQFMMAYQNGTINGRIAWFQKAAEQGLVIAQRMIGLFYFNDFNSQKDENKAREIEKPEEAVKWFKLAAEQGDIISLYSLASIYETQENLKNEEEAFKWYHKLAEQSFIKDVTVKKKSGDPGWDFESCITWDTTVFYRWYNDMKKVEVEFSAPNTNKEYSFSLNKKEDKEKSTFENYKINDVNILILTAQNKLGKCYANGTGVEENETEAFKWYKKAAENMDVVTTRNVDAQYRLAVCYEHGWGCEKDLDEAVKWYQKDGSSKSREALERLGRLNK